MKISFRINQDKDPDIYEALENRTNKSLAIKKLIRKGIQASAMEVKLEAIPKNNEKKPEVENIKTKEIEIVKEEKEIEAVKEEKEIDVIKEEKEIDIVTIKVDEIEPEIEKTVTVKEYSSELQEPENDKPQSHPHEVHKDSADNDEQTKAINNLKANLANLRRSF